MKTEKLEAGKVLNFKASKNFKYMEDLGSRGTGNTRLFKDEETDMLFAIKKYDPSPENETYRVEFYNRFVDEIKILFQISHPNIVRIYDYYLYPEMHVGYLQMEYVKGISINKYNPFPWERSWEDIFIETIKTFIYLEEKGILHRDIRPNNLLLDENQNLKLIDFGFGKKVSDSTLEKNSILLNWPVSEMPLEVNEVYTHQTEIFFLGKLFKHIIEEKNIDFKYKYIISKMTEISPEKRYSSFKDIYEDISKGAFESVKFSNSEKEVYINLADALSDHISVYTSQCELITDIKEIINKLENVIKENYLEEFIQSNSNLIRCFINNSYRYKIRRDIRVDTVVEFYDFFINLSDDKKNIVLENLQNRLKEIPLETDDDLPF